MRLRLRKFRRLTEDDIREVWRVGRRRCSLCGKVPTLREIGMRFGVTGRAIFYTLEYRSEPPKCPKLKVQARSFSDYELAAAAKFLAECEIAWEGDEQLRLAAQLLRSDKAPGFASELAMLFRDEPALIAPDENHVAEENG